MKNKDDTIYHIVAKHKVTEEWRDMYYPSLKDAEKKNPSFEEFRYVKVKIGEQK